MKSHAVICVNFLSASEGGRKEPITGKSYGCPMLVEGRAFDCRFVLDREVRFDTDQAHRIEVSFLSPEAALQAIRVGQTIELWEGKVIARGTIEEIPCQ